MAQNIDELENLTTYPADAEPQFDITFKKITSYGDTENVLLGPRILDVQVDANNKVYMLDFAQQKVHVFNPDGSFYQSVGRQGRGPGEFQRPMAITLDEDYLYVLDNSQFKISIFKLDNLELLQDVDIALKESHSKPSWKDRTRKKKMFYKANNIIARGDGTLFVIFSDNTVGPTNNLAGRTYEFSVFDPKQGTYMHHDLLSFDWTGGVLKTEEGGSGLNTSVMFNVPYKRTSQFDYVNSWLVYGWTENFLLKFYTKDGKYKQAFYYPFKRKSLTEEKVFAYYNNNDRIKNNIQKDDLPEMWPAFQTVVMNDENQLWVSTFTDDPNKLKWLVLQKSGKLLATFEWPRTNELKHAGKNYVYTLQRNEETGVQSVVKYQFELK